MTDYLKLTTDYHDTGIASAFDELSFWSSRFGHLLFDHLEIRGHDRILDIGFGTGFPLFELARVFGRTSRITGLDVWKEGIERARVKSRVYDLPNVAMVEGDGARQPFADASFNLIVSNLGINNFASPLTVLAETFRVAHRGAKIVLTTNLEGHYEEFYAHYRAVLSELDIEQLPLLLERLSAQEAHRGTKQLVCRQLEDTGFKVVRTVEDKFQMRFLDGSAMLRHSLVRFGFLGGWRSILPPGEEERVFALLEKRLNQSALQEGELRMTVPMLYVEGEKP